MKKPIKKLVNILICFIFIFAVSTLSAMLAPDCSALSCSRDREINYGYFRVRFVQSIGMADIISFTELGRQQEILIVPSVVDGWPVRNLGEWEVGFPTGFRSENLRKLYIPHQVLTTQSLNDSLLPMEEIVIMRTYIATTSIFNVTRQRADSFIHPFLTSESRVVVEPNVLYLYNFVDAPNQGYFWFDYKSISSLHLSAPAPYRYGYVFTGWYLEPENINRWDNILPISTNYKLTLFANWQQI